MRKDNDEFATMEDFDRDDWLPLIEAAQLTGKSLWTLYTVVRKGRIESFRDGHRIFVNMGSLVEYFRRRD
jgi:hypothetical protein